MQKRKKEKEKEKRERERERNEILFALQEINYELWVKWSGSFVLPRRCLTVVFNSKNAGCGVALWCTLTHIWMHSWLV